jgi:hypothetical protein
VVAGDAVWAAGVCDDGHHQDVRGRKLKTRNAKLKTLDEGGKKELREVLDRRRIKTFFVQSPAVFFYPSAKVLSFEF